MICKSEVVPKYDERELEQYSNSYWPMPSRFVEEGHLARLWRAARVKEKCSGAAIGLLPAIGIHMNTVREGRFFMGQHGMGRLAGLSVTSVRKGGRILERTGIGAVQRQLQPNGLPVSVWSLNEVAYVKTKDSLPEQNCPAASYLSFPARALYGGNWSQLTPVQQAMYLAVGATVRTHDRETSDGFLRYVLPEKQRQELLNRTGRLMITTDLPRRRLADLTGISPSALSAAIGTLPRDGTALLGALPMKGGGKYLFVLYDDFALSGFAGALSA
jgi:hypothetical protein